jgi:O-succinylbenzoate synthase
VPSAFPQLEFFSLTLREVFRGLQTRDGILFQGPAGWGEFSPFPDYTPQQDALWLRAALESAFVPFDYPTDATVSVNAIIGDQEDAYLGSTRALEEFGCTTIKIKVGLDLAKDIERVNEIVRAFGESKRSSDLRIRLDANGRWSIRQALDTLAELESAPIEYVEQPCTSVPQLRELHKKIDIPIAVDESIRLDHEYRVSGFADLAIVKVSPLGGVGAVEKLIEKLDVPIRISGALESSVGLSASLYAAYTFAPGEVTGLGTGMLLRADTLTQSVVPREGRIRVMRCEPREEELSAVGLAPVHHNQWRDRFSRAMTLIPKSLLASWGVPDHGMQG